MHSGEIWDFVASAKGGSGLPSASFASQNSPLISNFHNLSLGEVIISFARILYERNK
ncbi:hypothetical protein HYW72_02325 [Candidatus Nomurabacteria bacterium]|nr:hypothetical protein [Candidatus Nomurabacteria bacterium]